MTTDRIHVATPPLSMLPFLDDIAAAIAYFPDEFEPDITFTIDGKVWVPATDPARLEGGSTPSLDPAEWTGDRFIVAIANYSGAAHSNLLQTFDGRNWDWHPDGATFGPTCSPNVITSNGQGIVVVASNHDLGPDADHSLALSTDHGGTWALVDTPAITGAVLNAACDGNRIAVRSESGFALSIDAGATWTAVSTAGLPADFEIWTLVFCAGWIIGGYDGLDTAGNTVMYRSTDVTNWIPIDTPWNADYPPTVAAGLGESGQIYHMTVGGSDRRSLLADGYSPATDASLLVSRDAGHTWFEIGYVDSIFPDPEVFDPPFGEYLPVLATVRIDAVSGAAFAFDKWFISTGNVIADDAPPIIAGSSDLQTWTPVFPNGMFYTQLGPIVAASVPK